MAREFFFGEKRAIIKFKMICKRTDNQCITSFDNVYSVEGDFSVHETLRATCVFCDFYKNCRCNETIKIATVLR